MGSLLGAFGRPAYLLLLPLLLPWVYLLSRRSLAGHSPACRSIAVGLRLLLVLILVLAAAEAKWVRTNEKLAVIYAVDVSASVPPAHRDAALSWVARSARSRDPRRGDEVGLIVFGRNAGVESLPRPADLGIEKLSTLIEREFTDIQAAIRLAAAVFPEDAARRLIILSDGNENLGRAIEEAQAARERRVEISVLPISYSYAGEIALDKLVVDPEVHRGEPFEVRLVVEATRPAKATLRLFENQTQVHAGEVDLRSGKNVFVVPRRLDAPGTFRYEATVEPAAPGDDAVIQNNAAFGFTSVTGEPRVLLCAGNPDEEAALIGALRAERIGVDALAPEEMPAEMEEYLIYDAILFSNAPAHRIAEGRVRMVEGLVKSAGLGFVMIGGEDSFGAGGYQGTAIEALLPVDMEIKQKKVLPNGALGIVMHSSEIDNGNFWAKKTVSEAIRILSPKDYAGVLYYDGLGGERWLFPMTSCAQKQMMLNRLANFIPGDMPDFSRIVRMAHQGLRAAPASVKHMIILSDGDPNPPTASQVRGLRADGITVSTISIGSHSNPLAMMNLARDGGGKFYELTDPQKLPAIFIRETTTVRKSLVSERNFQPVPRQGSSFLSGVDLARLPILKGYVITEQKAGADQEIAAPPGEGDSTLDPILATWTYGLGKTAAFTSDAGRKWGVHWVSWEDYRKFWTQLVRWVSRDRGGAGFLATRTVEGERGTLSLDVLDEAGNFINGLSLTGTVVSPALESRSVEARQVAPGRYQAEFPVGEKGTHLVSLRYEHAGATRVFTTGLSAPYSPEYRHLATSEDLLRAVASAAGGKVLDPADPAAVFSRDFSAARTAQDLWRPLVTAAAAVFFLDVLVRRLAFDPWRSLLAAIVWARSLRRGPGARRTPADPRLEALLRRKSEALGGRAPPPVSYEPRESAAPLGEIEPAGRPQAAPPPVAAKAAGVERTTTAAAAPAPGPKGEPVPATPAEPASYTERLLAAKRRAMEPKGGKREEKQDGSE